MCKLSEYLTDLDINISPKKIQTQRSTKMQKLHFVTFSSIVENVCIFLTFLFAYLIATILSKPKIDKKECAHYLEGLGCICNSKQELYTFVVKALSGLTQISVDQSPHWIYL